MSNTDYISIRHLCTLYNIEVSFVTNLTELGLVEITTMEKESFVHRDRINEVEKMLRLHRDLSINPEGIDVVFNLLEKVEQMQEEVTSLRNRLRLYEDD